MNAVERLATELTASTGLSFTGHQRGRLLSVLRQAAQRARCHTVEEYAGRLLDDSSGTDSLVSALTVGETYFFRDPAQVALLRDVVLRSVAADVVGPIDVWSAGCASGEEPYSIAMLAADLGLADRVRLLGTDLSAAAIARAESGIYSRWSLRATSDGARRAWFDHGGDAYVVGAPIRQCVRFAQRNLLDGPPGRFHVVICRNVLIYLTPAAISRAAEVFRAALRDGGWLVTGASDPELVAQGLVRVQTPAGLAYRATEVDPAPMPQPAAPGEPAIARRPVPSRNRPRPAARTPAPAPRRAAEPEVAPLQEIRDLADRGRVQEALAAVAGAIERQPLDAELRYLAAVLHLDAGDADGAAEAARAALYLDPRMAAAHLVLGHCDRARGHIDAAARSYRAAARELAALPPEAEAVRDDGQPAGYLAAMAAHLAATMVDERVR